jgi:hypothetical protein
VGSDVHCLEPIVPLKRYTSNCATPIGANTMFLQTGKRYIAFSELHQFLPTLPIIWAQVAAKRFSEIQDDVSLKLKQ